MKTTRQKAWDWLLDDLEPLLHLGVQEPRDPLSEHVSDALDRLTCQPMPVDAIQLLSDLVKAAFRLGRDGIR
jgi:hypothetical protein